MKPENSAAAAQRTVTPRTGDAPRWLPAMTVATGMACALIGGQGNAWAAPDEGATSSVSRPSTGDTARDRSRERLGFGGDDDVVLVPANSDVGPQLARELLG